MPYKCTNPSFYLRKAWGTGQCVELVKKACGAPQASTWKQGALVKGNMTLPSGTAIATFQDGKYQNRTNGDSHAAIYIRQSGTSLHVIDHWTGQAGHERDIRFQNGSVKPRNDGDAYYIVE